MQVKSRHHLRSDEIAEIEDHVAAQLDVAIDGDQYELVEFEDNDYELVLVDGEPAVVYIDGAEQSSADDSSGQGPREKEPFLTVRGANEYPPENRVVTVDAGAISFVSDGADVMRPGIVEADDDIEPDDLVAIAEESHGKVLAIGRAKTDGDDMVGDSGKVVESIHHVGDDLYEFNV